jgi:hypothetical protein
VDGAARAARPNRSLTPDNSASSLRKEPTNRSLRPRCLRKQGVRDREAGSFDSQVVLVDRFDCRSRRAACGVVRSRAKSSRKRRGLAPPHRSEERKSVGSRARVAKPEFRWRVHVRGAGESRRRVDTRRGKALRAVKPISFDEGVAAAVLAVSGGFGRPAPRQGASEARSSSSRTVENAVATGRRLRGSSIGKPTRSSRRSHPRQKTKGAWSNSSKLAAPRQGCSHSSRSVGLWLQRTWPGSRKRSGSPRESDRSSRCSCRENRAVAEIGETRLLRLGRGESQDLAG